MRCSAYWRVKPAECWINTAEAQASLLGTRVQRSMTIDAQAANHWGSGGRRMRMSECLHCDIHELLESQLEGKEANLAEIAAKVTEVLADLVLMAPVEDQSKLMADILANLGSFVLEKKEDADPTNPRRSSH